ncbi:Tyrosinase [Madurella mycetomatis]|uniref:Tyrosinase n=1 Tax=Madurella mycetomatis TaxID=100816 RepID=A0A175W227_9PEZI|nr:Tyrosinase [Madurella mycetomatis]
MQLPSLSVFVTFAAVPWAAAQQLVGIQAGVNPETGERPARLNINDLHAQGGPAWDLFIQALSAVQEAPEDDWLSWYQIAGIHGLPFKPYNGVGQVPGGNDKAGYCPHGQITFLTWHRAYIALLEQSLHGQAERIAAQYSGESAATYRAAAETLRFPYWDWAEDAQLPPVTTEPTVQINGPNGPLTLHNPLYSYEFQTFPFTDPDFQGWGVTQFNETKRCTDAAEGSDGVNHYEIISQLLSGSANRLKSLVYSVFTSSTEFAAMASTHGTGSDFENPHNIIHQQVGGGPLWTMVGHIQPVAWAGFDPIFWLHHTNVDRYFAMWQAIYYTSAMFNHTDDGFDAFGVAAGPVTADTPLKPFLDGAGEFWTSNRVSSTREFGYTYPGLNDWALSPPDLATQVTALVNQLYAPPEQLAAAAAARPRDSAAAQLKDYAAQVRVDRADPSLPLPCTIELQIGDAVAGEYALLAMPNVGSGSANIPLQRALEDAGVPLDKPASEAVAMLKEKLRVVVRKSDGEILPPTSVSSLAIEVEDRDFFPARSVNEFPHFGEKTSWPVDFKDIQL